MFEHYALSSDALTCALLMESRESKRLPPLRGPGWAWGSPASPAAGRPALPANATRAREHGEDVLSEMRTSLPIVCYTRTKHACSFCLPYRLQHADVRNRCLSTWGATTFGDFKDTVYTLFESDTLFLDCCLYCF